MTRMFRQRRIKNVSNSWMLLQVFCNGGSTTLKALPKQSERCHAARKQEGSLRAYNCSDGVMQHRDMRRWLLTLCNKKTTSNAIVSAKIFGRPMHYDIRTFFDRTLKKG